MTNSFRAQKKFIDIDGRQLAYIEKGSGDPIVLLHGNPTSSYLWRNVIPELEGKGRVIVPDLIGQGDSEKLPPELGPERYSFATAYQFLDRMLSALGVDRNVTLVLHDWGSGLGFHWACEHPDAISGIVYMEAIVTTITWDDWPEAAKGIFQGFRSDSGEELVLQRNMFIEAVLPSSIIRQLSDEEMAEYRRPFSTPDERQPTLNWPRQIPINGEPADVHTIVERYSQFMAKSDFPKLFINAEPGSILVGRQRELCRSWPNQQEVTVKGLHFIQEDSPQEIGQAIAQWLQMR